MSPHQRFAVKFYMVAMLFVVFDVELVFLYPVGRSSSRDLGWYGLFAMTPFLAVLSRRARLRVAEGRPGMGVELDAGDPRQDRVAIFERYPQKRGALLPALYLVQAEKGHVDADGARELAALFGIAPVEVLGGR